MQAEDAPEYTQPVLYKQIAKHPRTHAVFEQILGVSSEGSSAGLRVGGAKGSASITELPGQL